MQNSFKSIFGMPSKGLPKKSDPRCGMASWRKLTWRKRKESFKSQLKRADKSGAAYAVILGEDEVANNEAGLKPLRDREHQLRVKLEDLAEEVASRLGN